MHSRSHLVSGLGSRGYSKASGFVKMVPFCERSPFSVDKRYTRTNDQGGKNKTLGSGKIQRRMV